MKTLLSIPLVILCFAMLTAGNCPQNTGTGDDDSAAGTPSETPPQSALSIEFSDLSFSHTYGTTECPTPVGTVTITNSTADEATFTASADSGLIYLDQTMGTLAAGESVTIQVTFNCGDCPANGLTSVITVNVDNGTKTNSRTGNVVGTFSNCP